MPSGDSSGSIAVGDGYIQTLKRRIRHLEDLNARKRPRFNDADSSQTPENGNKTPAAETSQTLGEQQTPMSNVSVRDALKDFGHFALNVQDSNRVTYSNAFTMWYFVELAMLTANSPTPGAGLSLGSTQYHDQLVQSLDLRRDESSALISQYANSILVLYPFISEQELLRYHDTVLQFQSGGGNSISGDTSHCFFIVYMALATVCSNTSKRPVFDFLASKLWAHASTLGKNISSAHSVQCMISLALCVVHGQGYQYATEIVAMAMTRAIASGFHRLRNSSSDEPDRDGVQEKRRAFWIIYVLDRLLANTMGRPYGIEDQDISTQIPILPANQEEAIASRDYLLVQSVEHARLLSVLKRNSHRPTMYFTSLYQSWIESTSLQSQSTTDKTARELFLRLKCRLLVAVHNTTRKDTGPVAETALLDEEDIEDTLTTCIEWLRCLEARYDSEGIIRCVTDQYEIASVGIMCSDIQQGLLPNLASPLASTCSNVKMLSVSLLSYLSATYPAAAQMRKALSALDADDRSRLMDLTQQDQWADLVPRLIREAIARRISAT
ncbi:hypothetical protein PRZ48_005738 [Zasmidium cellare]|uniref:Xylanolytic transcriptional activator regulatory domain-containing protein n=1 Tax=Zasmidium cellare TaxID=395010 RepID=A0ABR0ENB9_ZASCE|nr:hypothetical protein PRZ48_005738 [Zasmidium cellare]